MPGIQIAPQIIGTSVSPVAVNNSVAELVITNQLVGQFTIPPNYLVTGGNVRVRAKGILSASGATTKIFKVKIGGAVYTFGTFTAAGALTNVPWTLDFEGTLQTPGAIAVGLMWGNGEILVYSVAGAAPLGVTVSSTTAVAIDTTVGNLINITVTEGNAAATDSVTLQHLTAEILQ